MKPIHWLPHARKKAASREINPSEAEKTMAAPDRVLPGQSLRRIFMRRYWNEVLQTEMLLCVVVEEIDAEFGIVTLYKTATFRKYEKGSEP